MTNNKLRGETNLAEDFDDIFDHALNGHVLATVDGSILRANSRIASWLGCSTDEMKGHRLSEFLTVAGRVYSETHLLPLLRMQGFFDEVALDLACIDGKKTLPVFVNAMERRDADGTPLFVRVTIYRAADRRSYEQQLLEARQAAVKANNELRALNATLEQRVTREVDHRLSLEGRLSNERELSALREQFIAVLGHDLRNPLASISGGVHLMAKTPLNDRAKMLNGMMGESVTRMAELIDNVMDLARGRMGGGLSLNRQDVEMEPILSHVVEELRIASPHSQIGSTFTGLERPVYCDPGRLSQLLSNLVGNAVTHGAKESPIDVRGAVMSDAFELSVGNAGTAIPQAALARIFQPFTRDGTRPSRQGLGLGLYIASEIARGHGGELTVQSSDVETRFTFRMPFQTDDNS